MLQILIWAVCVLILGIGYCGMYLEKLAAKERAKTTTGYAFFILMFLLAVGLFALSVMQGFEFTKMMK